MSESVWEEAFDEALGRVYYFNRLYTSWTLPETGVEAAAEWQPAFDEASQTPYFYNVLTGETAWTLPEEAQEEDDLSYLSFAVLRLQSWFRGGRVRKQVRKLLRSQYQVSVDSVTGRTLYTNVATQVSSWTLPALFTRLRVLETDPDEDDSESEDDFDAFQRDAERDAEIEEDARRTNEDAPEEEEELSKPSRRRFPRSKAQQLVDAAEDAGDQAETLELQGLNAFKVSSRVWNLQFLRTLSLAHNLLARIPSGIQDLIRLECLNVSFNALTRLPSCLQTTTTLTTLLASHNRIQTFSPKLWKLRGLRHLDLAHNLLKILPYVEGDLKLLRETREWQIGVGLLVALEVLLLQHNRLVETPKSLEKCSALVTLDLSYNQLKILSDEIGALTKLETLNLSHNGLQALPEALGDLASLQTLDVAHNLLVTLPERIGELRNLETLLLSHNQLQSLPVEMGTLNRLNLLELDENPRLVTLAGFFRSPSSIASFSASKCGLVAFEALDFLKDAPVETLNLSQNAFTSFPLLLGHSAMQDTLLELQLAGNNLTQVPLAVLLYCTQLKRLNLSSNALRSLPTEIAHLRRLEVLDLGFNALSELPDELTQLPQLGELNCAHNQLQRLPLRLGKLTKLTCLNVESNRLRWLPTSTMELSRLKALYASENLLTKAPPAVQRLQCFCDFSNNPFTVDQLHRQRAGRDRRALAAKLVASREFKRAEELLSKLVNDLEMLSEVDQKRQRPELLLQRGLCRVLLVRVKTAQQAISDASRSICDLEQRLNGEKLLSLHQKTHTKRPKVPNDQPESLPDAGKQSLNSKSVETDRAVLEQIVSERSQARAQLQLLAIGGLQDLQLAIRFGTVDMATAYHLEGLAHLALQQYAEAVTSFTNGLHQVYAPLPNGLTLDNQESDEGLEAEGPEIPETSIQLFQLRAAAYRGLGQLPAALTDLRHVISRYPMLATRKEASDMVTQVELEYTQHWEEQQAAFAIDGDELRRAFDVEAASGLARRPEVRDVHTEALKAATSKVKKQNQNRNDPTRTRLSPSERFRSDCDVRTEALKVEKQRERQQFESQVAQTRVFLAKTRDFKRELRATLQMEQEETQQRAVERERARLAELQRLELAREFEERLVMKYEDDLMQWLVSEEQRLEAERLQRLEDAQRKAEAKAAYATRLARRGGKRQAAGRQRK
ncbi:hypothetical protein BBJ28_00005018 [Nothophytophthora sp. Chile5]|nr:hypothetical protein BBJ28_00005018 [Nothophytophthora sp. Chile5]